PLVMVAVAVPAAMLVPFTPVTVIVSTCGALTGLVAVAGPIEMNASTHFFSAFGSGCPAAVSFTTVPVVRVRPGWPSTEMSAEAWIVDRPVVGDVLVKLQDEVVAPAA